MGGGPAAALRAHTALEDSIAGARAPSTRHAQPGFVAAQSRCLVVVGRAAPGCCTCGKKMQALYLPLPRLPRLQPTLRTTTPSTACATPPRTSTAGATRRSHAPRVRAWLLVLPALPLRRGPACSPHSPPGFHLAGTVDVPLLLPACPTDDFYPTDRASHIPHLAACAFNGLFLSPLALPGEQLDSLAAPSTACQLLVWKWSGVLVPYCSVQTGAKPSSLRTMQCTSGMTRASTNL